jgi:pimeloyl-ACP methyl ester carboxylesterase
LAGGSPGELVQQLLEGAAGLGEAGRPDHLRPMLFDLGPDERRRIVLLRWLYRLAGPVPPLVNLLVDALLGPRARAEDPEGAALVGDAFGRADRRGMQAAIGGLSLGRPDLTPVLDRLDTPTLLTTGEHDPMWTVGSARAAAAHLANGALVILPGAGHIGPLLQAGPAMVELVGAFWSDPAATIARYRAVPAPAPRPPVA